jgi:predicted site-specific integrase-resolvase
MSFELVDDDKFLTKGEVAQLCRVDVRTVDRWRMAGKIACRRTPGGGVLFLKRDVLSVIAPAATSPSPRTRDR